jgi:hypothetical protein
MLPISDLFSIIRRGGFIKRTVLSPSLIRQASLYTIQMFFTYDNPKQGTDGKIIRITEIRLYILRFHGKEH